MPIILKVKFILLILMIFSVSGLFAAPLESGYALAPRPSASAEEKILAYVNARNKVIEAARRYEGTPYRYGGMTASGLDCSGFICLSFQDALGVSLPRSASGLFTWTVRTPIEKAQPGDFLFFRTDNNSRNITHVGLYLGGRRFIHSASAGSKTGVIYSSLDEQYWRNAFAGAGRAFPEAPYEFYPEGETSIASGDSSADRQVRSKPATTSNNSGNMLVGIAIAPIWNGFIKGGDPIRGVSSQFYLYADTYSFGPRMVFGFELRPEYDGALGVFSLPITFSWGPNEKIRIFAGPVINFGEATLTTENGERHYSSGTSWLGMVGFTAAPFVLSTSGGEFSPYIEAAWQSYFSDNKDFDFATDFSAGFRFSTGVRWLIKVK